MCSKFLFFWDSSSAVAHTRYGKASFVGSFMICWKSQIVASAWNPLELYTVPKVRSKERIDLEAKSLNIADFIWTPVGQAILAIFPKCENFIPEIASPHNNSCSQVLS